MEEAAWLQAGATVVLVVITAYYAYSAGRQTDAARKSAEAARETADATERSLRLLATEKRRTAVESLYVLRERLQRLSRIATQQQRTLITPGGDPPFSDIFDSETIQDLRGRAAGIGGDAGSKVAKALDATDEVNAIVRDALRQRHLHGDPNPYSEEIISELDQALSAAWERLSEAEKAVTERLDRFQAEGPYQPLPELADL